MIDVGNFPLKPYVVLDMSFISKKIDKMRQKYKDKCWSADESSIQNTISLLRYVIIIRRGEY